MNQVIKRAVFLSYSKTMELISRTGIARILLPLKARINLGKFLRHAVSKIVIFDTSKPYNVLGHKMYFYHGSATLQEMAFGTYELDTVDVFRKIVKPGMSVVDIGAHVGYYTLLAARLVGPDGRVYAFEPNPEVYEILVRNIEVNGYHGIVRTIPKAVSNRRRIVKLYIAWEDSGEASLYLSKSAGKRYVEVETLVLDEFLAAEGWPKVGLVKVDVEGAELEVLEGMRETARRSEDLKLIVEFNPGNQMRARGSCTKLFEILGELGFKRFHAIRHGLKEVILPHDVEKLIRLTDSTRYKYVNLLCEM
jgi:FkbM family methyltransferase